MEVKVYKGQIAGDGSSRSGPCLHIRFSKGIPMGKTLLNAVIARLKKGQKGFPYDCRDCGSPDHRACKTT